VIDPDDPYYHTDGGMSAYGVMCKVDWEGGLFETAFGYGLPVDDISDEEVELKREWRDMVAAYELHFQGPYDRIDAILERAADKDRFRREAEQK
jgi:hypothetical protein